MTTMMLIMMMKTILCLAAGDDEDDGDNDDDDNDLYLVACITPSKRITKVPRASGPSDPSVIFQFSFPDCAYNAM